MKKMLVRLLCIAVATALLAGLFTGCSAGKVDTSKEVELVMYLLGDAPKDQDMVMAEFNKMVKKDLNATLKLNHTGWADFQAKYKLILSSGEKCDLIFAAPWCDYFSLAAKGAFMPLDDLLPKYAPTLWEKQNKADFEDGKVKGKYYLIPTNFTEFSTNSMLIRGDLRQKYGLEKIKDRKGLEAFLDAVKNGEKDMIPFNMSGTEAEHIWLLEAEQHWENLADGFLSVDMDDKGKLFCKYETPEFEAFCKDMKTWCDKGFWSKSILSNKIHSRDAFKNGKSAVANANNMMAKQFGETVSPDWKFESFDRAVVSGYCSVNPYINNSLAIPKNSKNPERALMLVDKIKYNRDYFDMLFYGIKGKHYDLTADGKLTLPAGLKAEDNGYPPDSIGSWPLRTNEFYRASANEWPGFAEANKYFETIKITNYPAIFNPNKDEVLTELAALSQLTSQYINPLLYGIGDIDQGIKDLKAKLKAAGIDKVKDVYQKQWNEFKKAKGF